MKPVVGFETAKAHSKPLSDFRATVEVSKWPQEVKGDGTKRTYSSALFRYWREFLSKKYASLAEWIQAVRTQRESKEPMVRKTWVSDVRTFMDTGRILNDKPMSTATKELLASSVKSFLRAWVDEELDHDFKVSYTTVSEQKGKFTPTTYEKLWQNLRERSGLGKKRPHGAREENADDFGEREHIHRKQ